MFAGSRYRIRAVIRRSDHTNFTGTIQTSSRRQSQIHRCDRISGIRAQRMCREEQYKYILCVKLLKTHPDR